VVEHLPDYLQDFARFAYFTGMRRGEIASLAWQDVDGDVVVRLRAWHSKNGEGRAVPLEGELAELIERCRAARSVKKDGRVVMMAQTVFHRDGLPILEFRKSWKTACCMAGIGTLVCRKCKGAVDAEYKCAKCKKSWKRDELKYVGRLFHDFRRSAVRDMVRGGTPESVAMKISGHKTQSMFTRYNIVSDADLRQALKATREYREAQAAKVTAMPKPSAGVN
jgi:integrase